MYIALSIMFGGFLLGRLGILRIPEKILNYAVFFSIFLLLFLLGASIGSNGKLLKDLPRLGFEAFLLMLFCTGGSIICTWLITPFYCRLQKKKDNFKSQKKNAD